MDMTMLTTRCAHIAVVLMCLLPHTAPAQEVVDLWTPAGAGDLVTLKERLATGADPDAREPAGQATPLMIAALFGETAAAKMLLEHKAGMDLTNKDGSTALHMAAFLGHVSTTKLLCEKGADRSVKNKFDSTALESVIGEWNEELEGVYKFLGEVLQTELDLERIREARPKVAAVLRAQDKAPAKPSRRKYKETPSATKFRGSYFKNGEIHVNTYGTPEGKPLTSGHQDFKPSWSKTGDMLVFFRRLKNDPVVTNWVTQICVINVDGTGFHTLTDGTHTDFNQTWTRDGKNTPIWNRKHPDRVSFQVMASKVGGKPGEEIALTDKRYHTWAYTCLRDGRILVQCNHPNQGWGYFLMNPDPAGKPRFERIDCEMATKGILDRVSVSPAEDKVCFEFQTGYKHKVPGRTLYIADFDARKPSITNARPFANKEGKNRWFAYPRWTKDASAIVYHASPSLYLYTLKDNSTVKVSTQDGADYRYPHCEATPK